MSPKMQLELPIFNDPDAKGTEVHPPGTFIKSELERRGWGQAAFAEILGRPLAAVNEVIKGKRALTPEMAVAIGQAFGQPPELWIHREAAYRITLVKHAADDETSSKARLFAVAPVKDLQRRGWIDPKAETANEIEFELEKFLGRNPLVEPQTQFPVALARKSVRSHEFSISQQAWLTQASRVARTTNARPYRREFLLAALPEIKKLSVRPELSAKLAISLAEIGVRLVIVEDLPRTRIDGAAFFLDEDPAKPVIALSLRFDRMDSFWHTFGHELRHIVNEDPLSLDAELVGENRSRLHDQMEKKADEEAATWLIAEGDLRSFALRSKPWFSKEQIVPFAKRMGVHPCIVVGQLQHQGTIGWDKHSDLRPKIREHVISTAANDGYGKRFC